MPTRNEFTYSCVERSRLCSTLSISMQVLTLYYPLMCLSINCMGASDVSLSLYYFHDIGDFTCHSICSSLEPEIPCYVVFRHWVVRSAGGSETKVAYWLIKLAHTGSAECHHVVNVIGLVIKPVLWVYQTHFPPAAHLLLAFSTLCCWLSHFSKTTICQFLWHYN